MATKSAIYYSASCDGCGKPFEHEDGISTLGDTAAEVTAWAIKWAEWLVYQRQLLCDECVEGLDKPGHDFITTEKTEPFCRICRQLPDASHPNVPMHGQTAIQERTS